jgi:hypothetical protein
LLYYAIEVVRSWQCPNPFSVMINGGASRRCCRGVVVPDGHGPTTGVFWKVFSGSSKPVPVGETCPYAPPSPSTCWRRLRLWEEHEVRLDIWRAFLREVDAQGRLQWGGMFCGRQFFSRQKGGDAVGKTKRGKGTKWMVVVDGQGIPLGGTLHSANPAEVTVVEGTLAAISVPRQHGGRPRQKPQRVIADRAYDSDPLRM